METRRRLEQERLLVQAHSEPQIPRRRLASFGGMGSSSSLSSYSSSVATSQISPSTHQPLSVNGLSNGEFNPYYSQSRGSSIRHSPMSSGVATPVTNVSPLHLQQIREQMVVALKRLKELEEQVKAIPILQVKIAVLQEEKRQLAAQTKSQGLVGFRKRSYSVGSADQMESSGSFQKETELHIVEPEVQEQSSQRLEEFRRLAAEVQALEKTTKENNVAELQPENLPNQVRHKSIGVVTDENMNNISAPPSKRQNDNGFRDVGMVTERLEMRSAGVVVTEAMLGVTSEADKEIELQQQTIDALKEKIYRLEVQLKETTHEMEMGKLKLELQAAGGSNKKKADKGLMVRPEMYHASVEAKVQMRSQGVGRHLEFAHVSTDKALQTHTVGVTCQPSTQSIATGPDLTMDQWVVHQRVKVSDQCVGRQVETCNQQVGMELSVCEAGVNTEESLDRLSLSRTTTEPNKQSRSVGCGDCSLDVNITPAKKFVSQGTSPDFVGKSDFAAMAAPDSASQHTSTDAEYESRSTNTKSAEVTDSSTDTELTSCDKQTSTTVTETRTVAAGDGLVKDVLTSAKTRSVAVGTTSELGWVPSKPNPTRTKECGVGPVNIHENFLIGLKTRNIACGPSQPADSAARKEEQTETMALQPQGAVGLDHYIERVQKLLQEQQMLLAENYSELADAFGQPQSQFGSINSQLVSTLSSINSVMKYGSAENILKLHSDSSKESSLELKLPDVATETANHPENMPTQQQQMSAAEQKSRMDLQMSTALHGQPCHQNTLKSIMKKKDGRADASGTKKNLQFVGVNGGYETTSSDESSSEDSSSSGSEEEEEDEEKEYGGKDEYQEVGGRRIGEEFENEGAEDVDKKDEEGSEKEKRERYELGEKMLAACEVLKTHLIDSKAVSSKDLRTSLNTVQHEWFRASSQKAALAEMVEDYLRAFDAVSPDVLRHIVNMADGNGNTALHYSVSHSNFKVVKKLLDADVCNVNQQNKAGYTPIMLAALAAVETPKDMCIVEELFSKGDVNARASQAGQTGLMLAVSHGRMDMVRALLAHGADVNVQDDEGSTALMCASEHGHVEIVKLLLGQAGCDATLSDSDGSNALSIALEAGHKDIAVLLYAHVNFSKAQSPGTPRLGRKTSPSPTRRGMFD